MLQIEIPLCPEGWDEIKQEFVESKTQKLCLEHSLVSVSKWEAKWRKPFLSNDTMTREETVDYIRCMTITQNVDPSVYDHLSDRNIEQVSEYINAPMTATWFAESRGGAKGGKRSSEEVTNELIYYWMIALNIPKECEKWHFNRLLTLVRVCNVKNQPQQKMGRKDIARQNAAINAARKKKMRTKG